MNDVVDCTLPEKILLAAFALEEAGQTPFSAEALVVSAWQKYPQTFGLKGYEQQYPDSNKVLAGIMGEKGLPRRGWLTKVGQKQYSLTPDGRLVVRKIIQGEDTPPLTARRPVHQLTRDQDILLQGLLAGPVFQKHKQNRETDWTFSEACKFWGLENRTGELIDARLDEVRVALIEIERCLGTGSQVLGNGRQVTALEVAQFRDLHAKLEQRFSRHLNLLRSRAMPA